MARTDFKPKRVLSSHFPKWRNPPSPSRQCLHLRCVCFKGKIPFLHFLGNMFCKLVMVMNSLLSSVFQENLELKNEVNLYGVSFFCIIYLCLNPIENVSRIKVSYNWSNPCTLDIGRRVKFRLEAWFECCRNDEFFWIADTLF